MVVLDSGSGTTKKKNITLKPGTVTNPFGAIPTYGHQIPQITSTPKTSLIDSAKAQLSSNPSLAGYGNTIKSSGSNIGTGVASGGGVGYQSLLDTNNSLVDAWLQKQMSTIDQQKVTSLASLEKSLNDALAQGQIDTSEASKIYDTQKAQIEQNAYNIAQATAINGQNAGIQDSAQMLALQQGDNARVQNAVTANNNDRASRLSAIQDRIAKFRNDYNTDVNTVNQTYNNALLGAQGEAGSMRNQTVLDLQKSALENAQSRSNMAYQSALDKSMYDYKAKKEAEQQANTPTDPLVQAFLDEQAKKKAKSSTKTTSTTKKATTSTTKKTIYPNSSYANGNYNGIAGTRW